MRRIALVNPPCYFFDPLVGGGVSFLYPLNLYLLKHRLADQLETRVEIIDTNLLLDRRQVDLAQVMDRFEAAYVDEEGFDLYGFTVQSSSLPLVLVWARRIKLKRPQAIVVLGGPEATISGTDIISGFECIDYVVVGEGEVTFPRLVRSLKSSGGVGQPLPGVLSRDQPEQLRRQPLLELEKEQPFLQDEVPFADYRAATAADDAVALVEAGRGCPNRCSFCSTRLLFGPAVRYRRVSQLLEEISYLRNRRGVSKLLLLHDNIGARRGFLTSLAGAIAGADLDISWSVNLSLDSLRGVDLELMKKAGCRSLFLGIESLDPQVIHRNCLSKVGTLDQVGAALAAISAAGIRLTCGFIIGFPDQDRTSLLANLGRICSLRQLADFRVSMTEMAFFPGTPVTRRCTDRLEHTGLYPAFLHATDLPAECRRLIERNRQVFSAYYRHVPVEPDHAQLVPLSTFMLSWFPRTMSELLRDEAMFEVFCQRFATALASSAGFSELCRKMRLAGERLFTAPGTVELRSLFESEGVRSGLW